MRGVLFTRTHKPISQKDYLLKVFGNKLNSFRIVISEAALFKAKVALKSNCFCGHLCDETDSEAYETEFSKTMVKDFSDNRHEKGGLSLSCQDCTPKSTLNDNEIGLQFTVFSGVSSPKFTSENTLELPLSFRIVASAGTSSTSAKHCSTHHCLLWTFCWTNSNQPEHRARS